LDLSEEGRDGGGEGVEREVGLDSVVSSNGEGLTLLDVLGADFESEGNSLDGEEEKEGREEGDGRFS